MPTRRRPTTTTKTLLAAAVVVVIGFSFYGLGKDPKPDENPVTNRPRSGPAGASNGALLPEDQGAARLAVPPVEVVPSWLDHPYTLALDVQVVDELGLPVRGRPLRLGPPDCPLNRASAKTGEDGHVQLSWPSRLPRGEVILAAAGGTLRRVALQHGRTTALTVIGKPQNNVLTLFRSSGGEPLSFTISGADFRAGGLSGGSSLLASTPPAPAMHQGLHPHAVFTTSSGARAKPAPRSTDEAAVIRFDGPSFQLDVIGEQQPAAEEPVLARIAGTVFGADGKPAAKAEVALFGAGPRPRSRVRTDDSGQFEFKDLQPAEFTLRAGGDDRGLATCPAITTTGTTPVTLHLDRGTTVRGHAESVDGSPLAKARVTWQAVDASWSDATVTDDSGAFLLANLPATPGTVMLFDARGGRSFPIAFAKDVLANTTDLLLREAPTNALRLEPVLPDGISGRVAVRIWDLDTGVGTTMPRPQDGGAWQMERLRAGWYRIEFSHPAFGTIDGGRHWVDGKAICDLGVVPLPAPAIVHLELGAGAAEPEPGVELYRIRDDLDVHVAVPRGATGEPQLLAPGDYALFWHDAAGTLRIERFTAEAGKTVEVRLPR